VADLDKAARYFEHFAGVSESESPLYSSLSRAIAGDRELLALTTQMLDHQPPANVLFGAVHFLILRGADHALSDYFASAGGDREPDGSLIEAFRAFCDEYRAELLPLLRRGRVQTNEVRRATFLLPAFAWVAAREGRPLATLEVGTAAGLLTLWDAYAYDYGAGRIIGESPLTLTCELRGGIPELSMPTRAWSAGIDVEPIHLDDADAADWLRALVWPDQLERMARLAAAIDIARAQPPLLVAGDGIRQLADVAIEAPAEATLVVHHSFALNQVVPEDRAHLERQLVELAAHRVVYLVAVEWTGPDDPQELRAGKARRNEIPRKTLARVHHHGAWLDWVA
jgi:hypothetical protein